METARHSIVTQAVRDDVDGAARPEVERRACQARTRAANVRAADATRERRPTVAEVWAVELGRILIHLRRTGAERYDAAAHQRALADAERLPLDPQRLREVRAAGHAVGSRVEVVGEERIGTVQQVLVTAEDDGMLARWYVVHVAELQVCRAYGCDELEAVSEAASLPVRVTA
jgi:hypothetical protein